MAISLSLLAEPVGSIKMWLRASSSVPVPGGWLVCDGSTVADPASTFNGLAVPDMRGRVARGHSTITNANIGASPTYVAGGAGIEVGGTDSQDFTHAHSWGGSHQHTFTTNNSGSHSHAISSFGISQTGAAVDRVNSIGGVRFTYAGINGQHDHSVTVPNHNTNFDANHQHNGTTDSNGNGGSTSNGLGVTDNRPAYRGLVWIIKVR